MSNSRVHATAVIEGNVVLGEGVTIGPFCTLAGNIRIGNGTRLVANVRLAGMVTIGNGCTLFHGCCIGEQAQNFDLPTGFIRYSGVSIGNGNLLREFVTIHAAAQSTTTTVVGDDNTFMVGVHVAHDCRIGNNVTVGNTTQIAGHARVDDGAYLSAGVLVHTHARIGTRATVDAGSIVLYDIPPFMRFSRRGRLMYVQRREMLAAGIDESIVAWYVRFQHTIRRGETWASAFAHLREDRTEFERELREFLRTSNRGMSPFARP